MNNILLNFASEQAKKIHTNRSLASFKAGDTVNVKYKITEGGNTRIQAFKGVVIAKTKGDKNYSASFTVRKISSNIGVERKFMVCSPLIADVEILKRGIVRRSKLYYLRSLTGKASRIKEKLDFLVASGAAEDVSAA
ncbi:MAG: 50S ribosomal protein L19 [Proteobacteria bacterium]|nr:50S ribosomal protein L19 [Pseudomonadota bacterium]